MSYAGLLPHTARVYRRPGTTDRLGQSIEAFDASATVVATFKCRLVTAKSGGMMDDERNRWIFTVKHVMHAEAGVDCAEDDLVEILTESGGVMLPKTRVKLRKDVYAAQVLHHVEFDLEVRRGPENG